MASTLSRVISLANSETALSVTGVCTAARAMNGLGRLRIVNSDRAPYVWPFSSRRRWFSRLVKAPPSTVLSTVRLK